MFAATVKKAALLLLCQHLFLPSTNALPKPNDPTGTQSGANDPEWPKDHYPNIITDYEKADEFYPFGHAPLEQQPCHIEVRLDKMWWEGKMVRRSVRFKIPRSDIPHTAISEAATVAWWYDLETMEYNPQGSRCGSEAKNFQIFEDSLEKEWVIDFNEAKGKAGDRRAQCAIDHFYDNWGRWTGCLYNPLRYEWQDDQYRH